MVTTLESLRTDDYDVLHVFQDGERIGEIGQMADGWAAWPATAGGPIRQRRLSTHRMLCDAVQALEWHADTKRQMAALKR